MILQESQIIILIIFLTLILNLLLNKFAKKFELVSKPNNRNTHVGKIPFLGGATIGIVLLVIVKLLNFDQNFEEIIIYSIIILIAGIIDDINTLTPGQKLILIILPIIWIVFYDKIQLIHLGFYEYFGQISLGKFSQIFTVLCIILFINAFNYIDGIDGLGISTALIFFIYLNFLIEDNELSFALNLISICYFLMLIFNILNLKIFKTFLGDGGSLMTGFIIAFFSILSFIKFDIHPVKIIYAISYPVYDFLTINLNRIISKKNIFKPGHDHLHHLLLKVFSKKHIYVMFVLNIFSIFQIIFCFALTTYLNYSIALIFFVINFILYLFIFRKLESLKYD